MSEFEKIIWVITADTVIIISTMLWCTHSVISALKQDPWAKDERQTLPWRINEQMERLAALTAGAH